MRARARGRSGGGGGGPRARRPTARTRFASRRVDDRAPQAPAVGIFLAYLAVDKLVLKKDDHGHH